MYIFLGFLQSPLGTAKRQCLWHNVSAFGKTSVPLAKHKCLWRNVSTVGCSKEFVVGSSLLYICSFYLIKTNIKET